MGFNLLDDPWIPLLDHEGRRVEVGLLEALEGGERYAGLATAHPLERAALLRLLLAAAQRIVGPDPEARRPLYHEGRLPPGLARAYLEDYRSRFDLEGPTPFLQVGDLGLEGEDEPRAITALLPELPQGGWPLIAGRPDHDPPALTPARAARALLVFQTFATGGLFNRQGVTSLMDAPAARPALFFAEGDNLARTLLLNLVPAEADDRPFWERTPTPAAALEGYRTAVPLRGPATRYTFLARGVRLLRDPDGRYRRVHLGPGWYPEKPDACPMARHFETEKYGWLPVRLGGEAPPEMLALEARLLPEGRPATLESALTLVEAFPRIGVAGQLTDPQRAAKVLGYRLAHVPGDRLPPPEVLEAAQEAAQQLERIAWQAVYTELPRASKKTQQTRMAALRPLAPYWRALMEAYTVGGLDREAVARAVRRAGAELAQRLVDSPAAAAVARNRSRALARTITGEEAA